MRQRLAICLVLFLLAPLVVCAAEVIPPSPSPHYIVDAAGVLSAATGQDLDQQLQQFERDTSNQIVVAIYPKMQSEDDIAAYAVRVFRAWQIGQKTKNNGVLLLVFIQDRKMNITTGYGLEGALPDATCRQIIDNELKPRFRANDFDGGIRAAVNAIRAATKGEYKGSGQTSGTAPRCDPPLLHPVYHWRRGTQRCRRHRQGHLRHQLRAGRTHPRLGHSLHHSGQRTLVRRQQRGRRLLRRRGQFGRRWCLRILGSSLHVEVGHENPSFSRPARRRQNRRRHPRRGGQDLWRSPRLCLPA